MKAKSDVDADSQTLIDSAIVNMNWVYPYYNENVYDEAAKKFSYASELYATTYLDYTNTPMQAFFYVK